MCGVRAIIMLVTFCAWSAIAAEKPMLVRLTEHSGMCDASAGAALDEELFLAVNDEDNTLRVYRNASGGPPVSELNLNAFLEVQGDSLESDLEGLAQIGKRIFIIGSHGLNREGKERFNRHRPPRPDGAVAAGSARATISTASATRTATAMYCRPAFVYVTGNPVVGPGI